MMGSENRQVRASAGSFLVDNADLTGLKALLSRADWFTVLRNAGRLEPGELPNRMLTIPRRDAQLALREIVRLVADLPTGTSSIVVWQQDGSELWVDTGTVALACREGLVTISVTVSCDQIAEPVTIAVPIAVGTKDAPSGLVMSTLTHVDGPQIISERWSDAITAFAWEALLELARRLCNNLGRDAAGLPLIPGAIASARDALLIQPMSRHDLSALGK